MPYTMRSTDTGIARPLEPLIIQLEQSPQLCANTARLQNISELSQRRVVEARPVVASKRAFYTIRKVQTSPPHSVFADIPSTMSDRSSGAPYYHTVVNEELSSQAELPPENLDFASIPRALPGTTRTQDMSGSPLKCTVSAFSLITLKPPLYELSELQASPPPPTHRVFVDAPPAMFDHFPRATRRDTIIEMEELSSQAALPPENLDVELLSLSLPDIHTSPPSIKSAISEVAIPIGDPDPPEKPGFFDFQKKYEQSEKTDDVRRKALYDTLWPLKDGRIGQQTNDLVRRIVQALPGNSAAINLQKAHDDLQAQLGILETAFNDFISLRIKQKQSSFPTFCDVRTLFFGESPTAVALRSGLELGAVAASGFVVQLTVMKLLENLVAQDPKIIPQEIIDKVTENVHKSISDLTQEQLEQACAGFAKPTSSMLDVDSSSNTKIYLAEAVNTLIRGGVGVIVYKQWEKAFQDEALKKSLKFRSEAPTTSQNVLGELKKSGLRNTLTGTAGLVAGIGINSTGKLVTGVPLENVFKDAGAMTLHQSINAATSTIIDMTVAGLMPSETCSTSSREGAMAALRIVNTIALQYLRTEIYAQFKRRPVLGVGDHVRAAMGGGLTGLFKESAAVAAALLAIKHAPADKVYIKKVSDTVNAFITLLRALSEKPLIDALLHEPILNQDRTALFSNLKTIVHPLRAAKNLKPYSYQIKHRWEHFDNFLHDKINQRTEHSPNIV